MMYVKHFVTCKALCTCVGDCSHYGHYYLTTWGQGSKAISMGSGLGGMPGVGHLHGLPESLQDSCPAVTTSFCLDGWGSRPEVLSP